MVSGRAGIRIKGWLAPRPVSSGTPPPACPALSSETDAQCEELGSTLPWPPAGFLLGLPHITASVSNQKGLEGRQRPLAIVL